MSTKPSGPFTARETELINIAFQSLKEKPIIDYEVMALKADLVGAKSARDQFNKLYSKLTSANTSSSGSSTGALGGGGRVVEESSPTKKGASSKKRKADESLSLDDPDAEALPASTKKKATTPRKERKKKGKISPHKSDAKAVVKANKDEDDDAFED